MLKKIVRDLERRRTMLEREATAIGAALGALVGGLGKKSKRLRKVSKAARAKMAKAQKLRWEKVRLAKKQAKSSVPGKSKWSAAARERASATQKARWAKIHKNSK
jgi:hypothetical protein